jgi:hypothetical protein
VLQEIIMTFHQSRAMENTQSPQSRVMLHPHMLTNMDWPPKVIALLPLPMPMEEFRRATFLNQVHMDVQAKDTDKVIVHPKSTIQDTMDIEIQDQMIIPKMLMEVASIWGQVTTKHMQ